MTKSAHKPQQTTPTGDDRPVRHILSLSGGKDSTALAIYMRGKVPEMECDSSSHGYENSELL